MSGPRKLRVCLEPGCPRLTRDARCPEHASAQDARDDRTYPRIGREVYSTRRWRELAKQVKREEPWCQAHGCSQLTTDVDHVKPLREGMDPYDRSNLQGLCKKHHGEKTAREAWGRT